MTFAEILGWVDSLLIDERVSAALRIAFITVAALVAIGVIRRLTRRIDAAVRTHGELGPTEGEKRLRTLANIVRYTLTTLVLIVVAIMILRETGIDVGPLLAGAGIAGVVIGFGAQNLVRDYLAGIFLLAENQYAVGDVIGAAGVVGTVEKVTLRITQLRDVSGSVHVIPNGEIKVVTNYTKEWSKALLDVGVAYKENVDRVMEVLREIGGEMTGDQEWGQRLLEPLRVMGVQDFGESAVTIRCSFKTVPDQRWEVARELRRRIKNRFDDEGIEIPFPHRTIYVGTGESGALRVATDGTAADSERPDRPDTVAAGDRSGRSIEEPGDDADDRAD